METRNKAYTYLVAICLAITTTVLLFISDQNLMMEMGDSIAWFITGSAFLGSVFILGNKMCNARKYSKD